jgi:hypothetical protein
MQLDDIVEVDMKYGPLADNNKRHSRLSVTQISRFPKHVNSSLIRKRLNCAPSKKVGLTFDVLDLFLGNFDIFTLRQSITEKYNPLRGSTKIIECLLMSNPGSYINLPE